MLEQNTNTGVMIIDDDDDILLTAELLLERHFSKIKTINDPNQIPFLLKQEEYQVFLLDMNFSTGCNTGEEGFYWMQEILKLKPTAVVILITAYGDIKNAVNAIKYGATDYILKPWSNDILLSTINTALKIGQTKNRQVIDPPLAKNNSQLVFISKTMEKTIHLIKRLAPTNANVLITGENGTGKGLIAQHIHALSNRANKPFISVDISTLSEQILESELFGHKKGAFTDAKKDRDGRFLAANGGTLFLDEIGNISTNVQRKLLKVLEDYVITPIGSDKSKKIDFRLITATNMPLQEMIKSGEFRSDLFYRLNTILINVPPLRERIDDIKVLIDHFLQLMADKYGHKNKLLSDNTLEQLIRYPWPGNVRELSHAVERAVIISDQKILQVEDFMLDSFPINNEADNTYDVFDLEQIEIDTIQKVLTKFNGNVLSSAEALKITRTSLYRRIKKYNL